MGTCELIPHSHVQPLSLGMRRSMAMRVFAAMVAAWFGFLTIQPLYADPCPHHQPVLAELAHGLGADAGIGQSMASHGGMPMDGANGMHNMPGHDGTATHPCHCLGDCCGTTPVAVASSASRWVPAAIAARIELAALPAVFKVSASAPPHTLPFATAPPTALLA